MYCTNCGTKIKDGEIFCTSCGQKQENLEPIVVESKEINASTEVTNSTKTPESNIATKNKKSKIGILLLFVIGFLIIAFSVYFVSIQFLTLKDTNLVPISQPSYSLNNNILTLSISQEDVTIYYQINPTENTDITGLYKDPLTLNESAVIEFLAKDSKGNQSTIGKVIYEKPKETSPSQAPEVSPTKAENEGSLNPKMETPKDQRFYEESKGSWVGIGYNETTKGVWRNGHYLSIDSDYVTFLSPNGAKNIFSIEKFQSNEAGTGGIIICENSTSIQVNFGKPGDNQITVEGNEYCYFDSMM
ncbi:MAG: chitobiase/beta-hexosaminidase C-terminal domain-containing protein [Eubacteriaceae bacterium]